MKKNRTAQTNKKAEFSPDSPLRPKPLRRVAVLGRQDVFHYDHSSGEEPQVSLLDFEALSFEPQNYEVIRNRLRVYQQQLSLAKSLDRTVDFFTKINRIWCMYLEHYYIAKARSIELSEDRGRFSAQYEEARAEMPDISARVLKAYRKLLHSDYLEDLSLLSGKVFFRQLNISYMFKQIRPNPFLEEEELLISRFQTERDKLLKLDVLSSSVKQTDILFDNLVHKRWDLAETLGFTTYRDYVWMRNGYEDFSYEELRAFQASIKKYLLPIHKHRMEKLDTELEGEEESLLEFLQLGGQGTHTTRYEHIGENVREYYERFWGDEDWELRNMEEVLLVNRDQSFRRTPYPSSPTFMFLGSAEMFFHIVCQVVDLALDRNERGFLEKLGQMGYVRMDFEEEVRPLEVEFISSQELPLLTGTYKTSSAFVASFLQKIGEIYQLLQKTTTDKKISHTMFLPSLHKRLWGLGMEMLTLGQMDAFFPGEGLLYGQERINKLLRVLLIRVMIDEFEAHVYQNRSMQMLDRVALWRKLREEYRMELYTDDLFWKDNEVVKRLIHKPVQGLIDVLPDYFALVLWAINLEDKKNARNLYETFCEMSLNEQFRVQAVVSGFPDFLDLDWTKRLAFKISYYLEQ